MHSAVELLWKQEHCGILPKRDIAMSKEDEKSLVKMEEETRLVEGKYEAPMLWKNDTVALPCNYGMARQRFGFLEKKLRADSELFKKYQSVIDGYLIHDPPLARKLGPEEARKCPTKRTWYLPTHPVTNPNKPEKIRVVNDAAAEYKGSSLNKALCTGPDLLNLLVGVLMRFRNGEVAIAADIEAMFHQIRVPTEDSDSLRFLWKDDITSDGAPDVYQMLVHIFGAKDSANVANYVIKRTARDNCTKFRPIAILTALRSFYVDDLLKALKSPEEAIYLLREMIEMMKCGGFRLCKILSNSKTVLKAFPETELSPSATLDIDEGKVERALGISWDTNADVFTFKLHSQEVPATKRGILRATSMLFDPLGFLTPFILIAKLIIQSLWRSGVSWDQRIDDKIKLRWENWLLKAEKVNCIRLDRQYAIIGQRSITGIQLHVFCDASESAFGCVAYIRYSFKDGSHASSLVMAKSKLAPIKAITLPRLELNAARCGARLAHLIVHEIDLPIERVHFWSDSTLTLQYINNTQHRMKVFVANRVAEILELSEAKDWSHVPGNLNPADMLTRGIADPEKLMQNRWFQGPEFLENDEEEWPAMVIGVLDTDTEMKTKTNYVGVQITETIRYERTSSWIRLRRIAAWVLRFIQNVQSRSNRCIEPTLSTEEVKDAETMLIKDVQMEMFHHEIQDICKGKPMQASNPLSALSPFIDQDGLMRVGGRLRKLPLAMETKHPILLPRKHHVTRLLVDWIHRSNGHVGPEHVLSIVREKYWIMSGRVLTNQVVAVCFLCRIRRAKKLYPYMADLPVCRAAIDQPPFHHCGVDMFGPITVKQGRARVKRWVLLFTCLTIRCVHLEVVHHSDTDSFINAVRRFVNRRGSPSNMYSDNGSNFKGATTELKEFQNKLDKVKIKDFASTNNITWTFNPPEAPHMGGVWERLIRSTKEVMYGLVKNYVLTDPQLLTLTTEVEQILNSRPLTHLSDDVSDLEALTPNHVLLGAHRNWASITDTSEADVTSRKKWKQVQALRSMFWSRWVKEYLPELNKRPCWKESSPTFGVGELVLVQDDDLKRGKWPLGRITDTFPGDDGIVRVVQVRMRNNTYTRPVTKLIKLEDHGSDFVKAGTNVGDITFSSPTDVQVLPPEAPTKVGNKLNVVE